MSWEFILLVVQSKTSVIFRPQTLSYSEPFCIKPLRIPFFTLCESCSDNQYIRARTKFEDSDMSVQNTQADQSLVLSLFLNPTRYIVKTGYAEQTVWLRRLNFELNN